MKYYKITERNQHEREAWNFYIPVECNEQAIFMLKAYIECLGDRSYTLYDYTLNEEHVDKNVNRGLSGYMAKHNKLEGKLKLPEFVGKMDLMRDWTYERIEEVAGENPDFLYKGGVRDLMEVEE